MYLHARTEQGDTNPAGGVPLDAEHSAAAEKCPCFTHFVNHIVRQLIDNLVDKSRTYPSTYSKAQQLTRTYPSSTTVLFVIHYCCKQFCYLSVIGIAAMLASAAVGY